jgi:hypothetical protein
MKKTGKNEALHVTGAFDQAISSLKQQILEGAFKVCD